MIFLLEYRSKCVRNSKVVIEECFGVNRFAFFSNNEIKGHTPVTEMGSDKHTYLRHVITTRST